MRTVYQIGVYALPMVVRAGIGFAVLPLTTYRLEIADFGLFALITSISGFAAGASALGSMNALSSHVTRLNLEEQRDLISTLLWLGLATGTVLAGAVIAGWPLMTRLLPQVADAPSAVIMFLPVLIILGVPWNHASSVILVQGKVRDFAVINILESVTSVVATLVSLYIYDMGGEALFIGAVVGAVTNAVASLVSIRTYVRFRFSARWVSECIHVGGLSMVSSLLERGKLTVESYALANYVDLGTLGIYRHAQTYMNLAKSGANAVSFATWPIALDEARAPERGFPRLGKVWPPTQLGLAIVGVAMATLGSDAISLLTHGKFTQAYIFATLWIVFVMFENASKPAVAIMYAHNLGITNQHIALLAGLVAVVLLISLVAGMGAYGAIVANFISAFIYRGLILVAARRAAPFPFQDGTLFFGMAVVVTTLSVVATTENGMTGRLGMLAVAVGVLVIFCRSARQSMVWALRTMFA